MYEKVRAFHRRMQHYSLLKLIISMKLSCLLVFAFVVELHAAAFAQNVNLSVKEESLETVFKMLRQQSQYKFYYDVDMLSEASAITLKANNEPILQVLDKCFANQPLTYTISNNTVVVKRREKSNLGQKKALQFMRQEKLLKGQATDERNQPLPGVSVFVKGKPSVGTVTDVNGHYQLSINDGDILVFTYTGYRREEMSSAGKQQLDVQLAPEESALDEVVVVGYGTRKKSDLTGTVVSMNTEEITKARSTNAQEAMQGRLAGVDVKRSSGKPGADMTIEIRGANSIGGNTQPLYILDGIPVTNINDINPADIERMDILKDASSTAIYGSRGANGVVIVTTKKGTGNGSKVTYDGYVGIANPYHIPKMMQGTEFVDYVREYQRTRAITTGQDPDVIATDENIFSQTELENINNGTYTDWIDMVKQNGLQTNHLVTVTGGSEKGKSFFSLGYQRYEGTVKNELNTKYTLNIGGDRNFGDRIRVGASAYTTFNDYNPGSTEIFRSAHRLRPTGSAYNEDGTKRFYTYETEQQITNPLFDMENEVRGSQYIRVLPNIFGEIKLTDKLQFRTSFSPDILYQRSGYYLDTFTKSRLGTRSNAGQYSTYHQFNYDLQSFFTYKNQWAAHKLDVMAGGTLNYFQNDANTNTVEGLPYRSLWYNLGAATTVVINGATILPVTNVTSNYNKQTMASFMARANYSYKDRYLLTVTGRFDGNSVLAAGNKSDFFPSAGLGWIVSEEDFFKEQQLINFFKLRFSYGQSGNAPVPNFNPLAPAGANTGLRPYATQITTTTAYYDFNGVAANGSVPSGIANPNLTWEKTEEYNLGLELNLLKNRIGLVVDLYNKTSDGAILYQQIPAANGALGVTANIGSTRNRGIEVGLNTTNIQTDDFTWTTNFNFAANKNEIVRLYGDGKDDITNKFFIGHPVRTHYDYRVLGVWQQDEAEQAAVYGQMPGQYKIDDINGDNKINAQDRVTLGSNIPKWFGGLTSTWAYKGLDLAVTLYTRQGVTEFNQFLSKFVDDDQGRARFNTFSRNYWTFDNPSNEFANNAIETDADRKRSSEYQDASYTKISNITLGYNFPKKWLEKSKFNSLRVYINAVNPFVFTTYDGWDPETASLDTGGLQAFRMRTFLFGINFGL